LLGVELVVAPLQIAYLAAGSGAALQSAELIYNQYGIAMAVRLVLVFLGAGILGLFMYQNASSPGREKILSAYAYSAFALVLVSEVIGRFIFYASHVRLGV